MKKTVYAYLHTHWDREWYRDKEDFNIRLLDVFDVVLDELQRKKAPFFYFDGQVVALLDYLKFRSEKIPLVKKLIKENKLAIGPYFVSADSYLINFRSMLKNLELGMKYSSSFGQKDDYIGYMADIFGISASAFKALEYKNIDKALIWRGVNPKKIKNNCNFIKNNIKTCWLAQGYFNDFFHTGNVEGIKKCLDKISKYSRSPMLLPIGGDHLGILKDANKKIEEINKRLDDYKIILTSPIKYFKKSKFENIVNADEFLDNSDTYILQGVYSARIDQKTKNALIQNKISRIVEPLNYYLKDKYSKNIDYIYETLIKNYAHDGIYGCSLDSVHRTINSRLEKADNALNSIQRAILYNFRKKHKLGTSGDKIGLFNLSNKDNLKVIKLSSPVIFNNSQILSKQRSFKDADLSDIYKIPVTEEIVDIYTQLVEIGHNKRFSYSTLQIKNPKKLTNITDNSIENGFIKLSVKNGKIKITDKKSKDNFEIKLTDIADVGDSYNFAPKGEYRVLTPQKSKIIYDGIIEGCLRVYFKDIELDIKLNNHSEFLNFEAKINNKKKNHKLQLVILTKDNIQKTVSDDAWGIITRKTDYSYKMQDFMPVERPYELKTNCYPMQSFVCANGVIAMTKGLNEYEIYNNELRICLLRCFGTVSNPKNPARAIPAGPNLATKEAQLIKETKIYFALLFGNHKRAYKNIDEFMENYAVLEGVKQDLEIIFEKNIVNSFIYGISEDGKISYNI